MTGPQVADGFVSLGALASDLMLAGVCAERLLDLAEAHLGPRRFGYQLDRRGVPVYRRAVHEVLAGPLFPAVMRYSRGSPGVDGWASLPSELVAELVKELRRVVATIDAEVS